MKLLITLGGYRYVPLTVIIVVVAVDFSPPHPLVARQSPSRRAPTR